MKKFSINATLTAKQKEFLQTALRVDRTFFGGAAGGGKSYGLMVIAGILMDMYPGIRIRAMRESLKAARDNLETKFIQIYPEKTSDGKRLYRRNKKEYTIYWYNGSELIFDFVDTYKQAIEDKHGIEQDILMFDEATIVEPRALKYVINRTRSNKLRPKILLTGNALGKALKFVRKEFIEDTNFGEFVAEKIKESELEKGRVYSRTYAFIPSKLTDNTYLMETGYEAEILELTEEMRRILLHGDWYVSIGQFFSSFDEKVHVYKKGEVNIKEHWLKYISLDWGRNEEYCVLWHAVDEYGTNYTYREDYGNGLSVEQLGNRIVKLSEGERIEELVLPHDMFRQTPVEIRDEYGEVFADTTADVMQSVTNMLIVKAPNKPGIRKEGWRKVHRMFYFDDEKMAKPRAQISEECPNLIEQLKTIEAKLDDPEEIKDHQEDHAVDSYRYRAVTFFIDTKAKIPEHEINKNTPAFTKSLMFKEKGDDALMNAIYG